MNKFMKSLCGVVLTTLLSGASVAASAAEVRVGLSARETYVGQPVMLRVQVANATKAEAPKVPEVDGVSIRSMGSPSRSTQVTVINGKTTTTTTQTFAYELTPQRAGTFLIPPLTIDADGKSQQTRAIEFVASKSETGDLLFVEIAGKEKQIYVGQSLDVTLKMWIRPYSDRRLKVKLSEGDMWRLISERTEWGPFAERVQQLAEQDQRPVGKEVLRKDAEGAEHSYYLYQLDATIYPKRPGTIDGDNVKIVVNYPTALGRSRGMFADFFGDAGGPGAPFDDDDMSPFGAQLTVQTVRPLVAQAVVEPINVLPIPTAGRPADYRGAVGQYQIAIDATPTHVKSGDPINLLIGVSGTGPMELVQAPPLAELPELTTDFKVPNEPLAGFVKGDRKIFQTTIRPRKPGITQIPPIPFSFFDPSTGKFETVHSKPVSIEVEKAEMLALDAVEHNGPAAGGSNDANKPAAAATSPAALEIFSGDNLLVNQSPWTLNASLLTLLLALPPVVVLLIAATRTRSLVAMVSGRFASPVRRLQNAIENASDAAEIGEAIKTFVARQYNLKGKQLDAEQVVGAIRVAGRRNLAIRCEQLLNLCDAATSMPFGSGSSLDGLKQQTLHWLEDWQVESQREKRKPSVRPTTADTVARTRPSSSPVSKVGAMVVIVASMFAAEQTAVAQPTEFSGEQQRTLLSEANSSYKVALEKVASDSAEAKQGFADAAEKYQLLVTTGISNSQLYFNLGNAYLQSGQTAKAAANYRRSLRIEPTMREAQQNLAYAEKLLGAPAGSADAAQRAVTFESASVAANDWLVSRISPRAIFVTMIAAWIAIWSAIGLRLLGVGWPWKTTVVVATLVLLVAGRSTWFNAQAAARHEAVVVAAGETGNKFSPGQVVELLQTRGDSVRVRAQNGETVWVASNSVEAI